MQPLRSDAYDTRPAHAPEDGTQPAPQGSTLETAALPLAAVPTAEHVLNLVGPRRHPRMKLVAIVVGALVLLAAAVLVLVSPRQRSSTPGFDYVTRVATVGDLHATITATGTVQALDQVDVGAEVSGKVRRVLVDFNQRVVQGQLLCEIDPDTYQAAKDQAQAQLDASRADLNSKLASVDEARIEAERHRALGAQGLVTQQQVIATAAALKRANAAREAALAQVGLAQAALRSAATILHKTLIKSPIDGVVLSREVEPGQTVVASFQAPVLFTLAKSLREMQLEVLVDEADIGQVREGQLATFNVDAYRDRTFSAVLRSIHNTATVQNNVVSYEARLLVDNEAGLLRPGMTATVTVTTGSREHVLLVPNAALRFVPPSAIPASSEGPTLFRFKRTPSHEQQASPTTSATSERRVWLLDRGNPRAVPVSTGLSDGKVTEVTGGELKPGTAVVVDMTLGS